MTREPQKQLSFGEWACECHAATNHFYDENLPYSFHLKMVVAEAEYGMQNGLWFYDPNRLAKVHIINAAWGHDLIEDARVSYSDILRFLGGHHPTSADIRVADIIFALSNNRGKTRAERANDDYYAVMRVTDGASYVKICDRIANVKYGILTGNRDMLRTYREENEKFIKQISLGREKELAPMIERLKKIFTIAA